MPRVSRCGGRLISWYGGGGATEDDSTWVDGGTVFTAEGKSAGACKELPGGFTGSATPKYNDHSLSYFKNFFLNKASLEIWK